MAQNTVPSQPMAENPPVPGVARADPSHMGKTMQGEPAPEPAPSTSTEIPSDVQAILKSARSPIPGVPNDAAAPTQGSGVAANLAPSSGVVRELKGTITQRTPNMMG
jgi:hypothetical protein